MTVHDNREMPVVELNGLVLGGGRSHRLGYTKKVHYSLGPPYSLCMDETPIMLQAAFDQISDIDYAHGEYMCSMVCYQVHT